MNEAPPAILLVAHDLMWLSKVRSAAEASGRAVRVPQDLDALRTLIAEGVADRVLVDLHHPRIDPLAAIAAAKEADGVRVVAYGSHVDVERLQAALQAGADAAMPNSEMQRRLPAIVGG